MLLTKHKIATALLMAAVVGIFAMRTTEAQPPKNVQKDLKPVLKGTWSVVANSINGTDLPKDLLDKSKVMFEGDRMTQKPEVILKGAVGQPNQLKLGEGDFAVSFELDVTKNPKQFEIILTAGDQKLRAPGIFTIESTPEMDVLKICYHASKRPQEFTSKADSGNILLILNRSKAKLDTK